MDLTLVIVNYNVRYFLEQCLRSVQKAMGNLQVEVYVVDNNSVDGSVEMVKQEFPWVKLIANQENLGFSKANNQAMRLATGRYVLLLNPDTVLQEDSLVKPVSFMDSHPQAGALGVKMIDGQGNFLRESKRGLPTPLVAFYKISGLSSLFPTSERFARYHLGHLPENQINEVDILAGAYMLMRKEALDKVGLLDEDYFMYGEDVDLSYRIQKGGYKNYYFPETSILHYKGESTKKGSLNYVYVFYNAMAIFAGKHFSSGNAAMYNFLIKLAIWFRASLAVVKRFANSAALPLLDAVTLFGGMVFLKTYWERNHRFINGGEYPWEYTFVVIPVFIAFWLIGTLFSGGYDKPLRSGSVFKGIAGSTLAILAIYALLPESLRSSRALILLGATWAFGSMTLLRYLLVKLKPKLGASNQLAKRLGIVGRTEEAERVENLLGKAGNFGFIGYINPSEEVQKHAKNLGSLQQLDEIIQIYQLDEIIFCAGNLSATEILDQLPKLGKQVDLKIAPPESSFVIGSHNVNSQGELYTVSLDALSSPAARRSKRTFDVVSSLVIALFSPILWPLQKTGNHFWSNLAQVFLGKAHWVGLAPVGKEPKKFLPAVITPSDRWENLDTETQERLNMLYAKSFRWEDDLGLLVHNWRKLGKKLPK